MHSEAHASLGWIIANAAPLDRRARNWCVLASVVPDLDAVPIIFGIDQYAKWHHTFGHNIFFCFIFSALAAWHCHSMRSFWFILAAFASHLVTDAYFSGWCLYLFWPFSHWGYLPDWHVGLGHPLNLGFIYAGFLAAVFIAVLRKRTPLNIFSTKLDALLISLFSKKKLVCHICGRGGNCRCAECHDPVCSRHASLQRNFNVLCPECRVKPAMKRGVAS
jgi:hypothetical protein